MMGRVQLTRLTCWIALAAFVIWLAAPISLAAGEPTVSETYGTPENPANANDAEPAALPEETKSPGLGSILLRFVFSLGVVVVLIYLLLRFLSRRHVGSQHGPFRHIGGVPLGHNKSLQAVQIGDMVYLLGVGDDVTLIRQIPPGDEQDAILAAAEWKQTPTEVLADWLGRFRKKEAAEDLYHQGTEGDFDDLLARQWEAVQNRPERSLPHQEEDPNRGERP